MTLAGPSARALRIAGGALVVLAVLTGCGPGPEEPVGLATSSGPEAAQGSAAPSGGEEAPDGPSGTDVTDTAEPEPSFTQPFVPGDPRVIALADTLPAVPPEGATAEDVEVVAALSRFMASWDAIVFGADVEVSAVERTATNPQLDRLVDYAAESRRLGRVVVGEPSRLDVRSVTTTGDRAEVDVCISMSGWVEYSGGLPTALPDIERYLVVMTRSGSDWRAADTDQRDATACST